MQMTRDRAKEWANEMCENGTREARMKFYNKFGPGKIAENLWNDAIFTYGIEYGILIAVAFIFGDLPDQNAA